MRCHALPLCAGVLAAATGFLVGCGGLGTSSTAQVVLKGDQIPAVNLIVTTNNDDATVNTRCGDQFAQDWCARNSGTGWKSRAFDVTTEEIPYAVYAKNDSSTPQEVTLEITLDGVPANTLSRTVKPGETLRLARIYNTSISP